MMLRKITDENNLILKLFKYITKLNVQLKLNLYTLELAFFYISKKLYFNSYETDSY